MKRTGKYLLGRPGTRQQFKGPALKIQSGAQPHEHRTHLNLHKTKHVDFSTEQQFHVNDLNNICEKVPSNSHCSWELKR